MRFCTAERAQEKDPLRYLLSTEQMLENDYPMPSYVADVFEKPERWFETPHVEDEEPVLKRRILSMDCEMVRYNGLCLMRNTDHVLVSH